VHSNHVNNGISITLHARIWCTIGPGTCRGAEAGARAQATERVCAAAQWFEPLTSPGRPRRSIVPAANDEWSRHLGKHRPAPLR